MRKLRRTAGNSARVAAPQDTVSGCIVTNVRIFGEGLVAGQRAVKLLKKSGHL